MTGFTHFDAAGNAAMVDVSAKPATDRTATARARVTMRPETAAMIREGDRRGRATCSGWRASPASWRPSAPPS